MLDIWFKLLLAIFLGLSNASVSVETEEPLLQLGQHKPTLGPIKILHFEPSPEDFYRDYVRASMPVLIRSKSPSWHKYIAGWREADFTRKHIGETYGRAYKRPTWTSKWPVEVRLKHSEFLNTSFAKKLYWDSYVPLNSTLLQHIPLPLLIRCSAFRERVASAGLLYANRNSSCVFHQDGSENFLFQISGRKRWLIANYSFSTHAYANEFDTQPGLSPVNPEKVDLKRFPLAAEIDFYEVTTEPGDMLYVPEYWWHHVRSYDPPIVSLNIWSEIFNFPNLENVHDVVEYTNKYAELRKLEPKTIKCLWQHTSLFDVKTNTWDEIFETVTSQGPLFGFPIYFGSDEGAFYAVDSEDGKLLWRHNIGEDAGSTPVVSHNHSLVYFAGEDAIIYAFDAFSGELRWTTSLEDGVASPLRLSRSGKVIYAASLDFHVYAINAEDGNINWKHGPLSDELWASPYVHGGGVIACVMSEEPGKPKVMMLREEDGTVIWSYITSGSVFASPAVDVENNKVYIVTGYGELHVIDLNTGHRIWEFNVGETCDASPVLSLDRNKLYFVTLSGSVQCLDLSLRKIMWKVLFNVTEKVMSSPLLSMKTNTLYAAVGKFLYAIDADTGSKRWQFEATDSFISSPRMDTKGVLYIGCNNGKLYAVNVNDGTAKWSLTTLGPVVSSVAMAETYVNVNTAGGIM